MFGRIQLLAIVLLLFLTPSKALAAPQNFVIAAVEKCNGGEQKIERETGLKCDEYKRAIGQVRVSLTDAMKNDLMLFSPGRVTSQSFEKNYELGDFLCEKVADKSAENLRLILVQRLPEGDSHSSQLTITAYRSPYGFMEVNGTQCEHLDQNRHSSADVFTRAVFLEGMPLAHQITASRNSTLASKEGIKELLQALYKKHAKFFGSKLVRIVCFMKAGNSDVVELDQLERQIRHAIRIGLWQVDESFKALARLEGMESYRFEVRPDCEVASRPEFEYHEFTITIRAVESRTRQSSQKPVRVETNILLHPLFGAGLAISYNETIANNQQAFECLLRKRWPRSGEPLLEDIPVGSCLDTADLAEAES